MKKMNSVFQFLSYFSLVIAFMLISNISMSGQSFQTGIPKLNSPDLVFKSQVKAIYALDLKIDFFKSNIQKYEDVNAQVVKVIIDLYERIKNEISDGNSVKSSATTMWNKYQPMFPKEQVDDIESKLVDDITIH